MLHSSFIKQFIEYPQNCGDTISCEQHVDLCTNHIWKCFSTRTKNDKMPVICQNLPNMNSVSCFPILYTIQVFSSNTWILVWLCDMPVAFSFLMFNRTSSKASKNSSCVPRKKARCELIAGNFQTTDHSISEPPGAGRPSAAGCFARRRAIRQRLTAVWGAASGCCAAKSRCKCAQRRRET